MKLKEDKSGGQNYEKEVEAFTLNRMCRVPYGGLRRSGRSSGFTAGGCPGGEPEETKEQTAAETTEQTPAETQGETAAESQENVQAEPQEQAEESQSAQLKDVAAMVGMKDEETADLFGGGEENWTADKSFYIGRNYQVDLYGDTYKVFTTCGEDKTVESVSIWIVGGERQVTDEEAKEWENRVTDMMGAEPTKDAGVSEGGSKNTRWTADGMAAGMNQMADILTISFQPAVGELK